VSESGRRGLDLSTNLLTVFGAIATAIGIAFTALWWIVSLANRVEDTQKRLSEFSVEIMKRLNDLQTEERNQFKELQNDQLKFMQAEIAKIPNIMAHIEANERAITENRAALQQNAQRIDATSQQVNERVNNAERRQAAVEVMAGQALDTARQNSPDVAVRRTR